ncbi:inositol monophosphatase/fructose-1,6-bisphosphatase family protein [Candidatus Nitrososphaera evergladensis SR1]|uniref:Inositol monophosphatase/fructose-1,6-bisphosphatase family protein n=1 Tax=Candidatus Nitrososphaera evergladensis SR1 TaxID=1459636 RepID=A0A075MWS2_9ARCH|nr:inositol monophosphatase family protein [Candidatus Nitrososphaera evergladensis]AIF85563.1 inositol monophosphatase/fructose-1,6-bisphosphatase family protein [Candidatus Nitrososphaera evergladensis SR1]
MTIIGALKDACREVHARTRGVAGTARGNRQTGRRGAGGDISRQIDLLAEKTAINVLKKHGIDATIIGEECGRIEGKEGYVIMDAIDGTTNASRQLPFYCCSLAYADEFQLSAVKDAAIINLVNGDLYYASKNKGAFCNGKRIRVREAGDDVVIGMNVSGINDDVIKRLAPVMSKANHVRQLGSLAIELCYLAKGSLDASIDFRGKVRPVDIAAACLIVREAGGQVYSDKGVDLDCELGVETRVSFVATAHEKVFRDLSTDLF